MSRATLIGCVAMVLCAATAAAAQHKGVDLTKLAGWDIVVAGDAVPSEVYAAAGVSVDLRAGERDRVADRDRPRPS